MDKVVKEGVITVEDGRGLASELEVVERMQFDCGFSRWREIMAGQDRSHRCGLRPRRGRRGLTVLRRQQWLS